MILHLRWQIERLFRMWKEHGQLDEWRSKKPCRILCEVHAKLGCWQDLHRSLVKAAQVVRREAGQLMVALYRGCLEATVTSIVRCMQSGCCLNMRTTNPHTSQFLLGTPLVWPAHRS